MASRSRIPGLQVPDGVSPSVRQFMEAVAERLRLLSGERGDSDAKSATVSDLRATSSTVIATTLGGEKIDLTLLPLISLTAADPEMRMLAQGATISDRRSVFVGDFLHIFGRVDQETTPQFPWSWENEDYGFDITGPAPRYRWVELPLGDGVENILPVDSAIWDQHVDSGVWSLRLRNDDDDGGAPVIEAGRTGLNPDFVNVLADDFEHLGHRVLVRGGDVSVPFTDGDTYRRVHIVDAAVLSGSQPVVSIRRPNSPDDISDKGYLYIANVVLVAAGSFDVAITCLDWGGADCTDDPPNETTTLTYFLG